MKAKTFILATGFIRENAAAFMDRVELNGKTQVTFSDTGSKSSRQRGYEWTLYEAIAEAGKGGRYEDEKNSVHFICKYWFCVPILLLDNPNFAEIWDIYIQLYGKDTKRMEFFVTEFVHTEKLKTNQMAEYLTNLINYYTSKGFELPDPDDLKLLK